ncbi:MAG: NAD(P)H-dependent glycerol-3-phosphate dehydrogenase [bacterium ADurb.Bin400]|nr:MAG: NAD(P)H-dependent glycerol-3-phosphate dehydrogenase [bacterium ADurb.Bin400]
MVAEGPETTKSVYQLSQKYGMEVPIVELVYEILHKDANPKILLELVAKVGLV